MANKYEFNGFTAKVGRDIQMEYMETYYKKVVRKKVNLSCSKM